MATDAVSDELEPPWWGHAKGSGGDGLRSPRRDRRRRLEILDADGVHALTIRRLGQELGTGAASLYWHVASKDELCERVSAGSWARSSSPSPTPRTGRTS